MLDEFDHLLVESIEGQALELGWIRENRLDIGPQDTVIFSSHPIPGNEAAVSRTRSGLIRRGRQTVLSSWG